MKNEKRKLSKLIATLFQYRLQNIQLVVRQHLLIFFGKKKKKSTMILDSFTSGKVNLLFFQFFNKCIYTQKRLQIEKYLQLTTPPLNASLCVA